MKLSDLVDHNHFIQLNLQNNYQYLDNIGNILESIHELYPKTNIITIDHNIGVSSKEYRIKEIRIELNQIWLHLDGTSNVRKVREDITKLLSKITEFIDKTTIQRVGWLIRAVYEIGENKQFEEYQSRDKNAVLVKEILNYKDKNVNNRLELEFASKVEIPKSKAFIVSNDAFIECRKNIKDSFPLIENLYANYSTHFIDRLDMILKRRMQ